ncbi:MAG: hypothetical protein ABI852_00215, partial [Gemmatimonadaceae bacterium]
EQFRADADAFPPGLRALLDAELAAGNTIIDVSHSHPAPPIGACLKLEKQVSTRAHESDDNFVFRRVQGSLYSGWFTDKDQKYFLLEAPLASDAEYPDMDAIREAHNKPDPRVELSWGNAVSDKFRETMRIDYEKWHDGVGYDLDLLAQASDDEKRTILSHLIPPGGWRDVEALAAIHSDVARAALHKALTSDNAEVRASVLRYAPSIATEDDRTQVLLSGLKFGKFYGDLSAVLEQVESFHPPVIVNALFRGLFVRPGDIATHFAAMLAFVHGKGDSSFDWELRPLFLKFNSDDGAERERAFLELCVLLELDPVEVKARIGE